MEAGDGNIKVVVRCRPLNSREIARGAKELIRMQGNQTFLDPPDLTTDKGGQASRAVERKTMAFSFDKSYWSAGPRTDPDYCSQQTLYDDLGKELLDHGFAGFNACILAYGQTGSGKSYSMMGYGADKGIIPQTCSELFDRAEAKMATDPNTKYTVEVSYIEIYNEKVRDLLNPRNKGNLKVREHPSLGPYVEDLSKLVVAGYDEMMNLMDEGNKARTVAATNMNETSSRSHAVFTLLLTQKRHDNDTNLDTEKVSRISLVDLAGSERAKSTGASGAQLKEGANINKSLTTLGKVISALALASQSEGKPKGKKAAAAEHIPYRDSVLTWLLKDSIGGNSKTAMIAAISPADYDETLSTLRYADQAKKIKNKAVVNEDPNAKLVRELKEELEMLRARVSGSSGEDVFDPKVPAAMQKVTYQAKDGTVKTVTKAELQEQLQSSEKLMQSLNETWEEKLTRTQEVHKEREKALEELGITVEKSGIGVHTPKKMPHLNEDPLMSECLIYQLKEGDTMVGRMGGEKPAAIRLSGNNILEDHCHFENISGTVTITATADSITLLNGKQLPPDQPFKLRSGFRIILGDSHVFRFNNPEEVRKARDKIKSHLSRSISAADVDGGTEASTPPGTPAVGGDAEEDADWIYAQREAALARLHGLDPGLDSLPDEDLNKLFDRITKLKTMRGHDSISGRPDSRMGLFRPESSMSLTDDVWSDMPRQTFYGDSTTDDTSLETNTNAFGSPEVDESSKMQGQLEAARLEFDSRLSVIEESDQAEDLKVEKEHMEQQLQIVQSQMKRLMELRAKGMSEEGFEVFEPTLYTGKQLRLIKKVLERWRAHRAFSMAETVLSSAVHVKEATVMSKELAKDVSYNFTIAAAGSLAAPTSALDTIAGLEDFGDVMDATVPSSTQPAVAVKVIDKRHNAIYTWSLDRLHQQLQRMRNLTSFIDRPSISLHFSSSEPFYDSVPPAYSFIGNSLVSLAPLGRKLSSISTLPIFCRYTAEAIGSCRVDMKVATPLPAGSSPRGSAPSTRSSSPLPGSKAAGAFKLTFFVTIDNIKGLSSIDFSSLHCQIRLSSFIGPRPSSTKAGGSKGAPEEVYISKALDMEQSPLSELKLRHTFFVMVTSKVATYLRDGYAPVEFFAIVRPTYLERLERWDEMREQRMPPRPTEGDGPPPQLPPMRRSETDFVVEQVHNAVAWLQVCELGADGTYAPVPVVTSGPLDPGSFCLRQGLQRRLVITLSSDSGKQLPWVSVSRVKLGNVRVLDQKGQVHESQAREPVELKLSKQQSVEFKPDGTGSLSAEALWDSGAHDSVLLNRVTPATQRVLLTLTWCVEVECCAEPVQFTMDLAVTLITRDSRPPTNFLTFLGTPKVLSKTSTVFSLRLVPPLTRSPGELWRLDTSEKYVRGEDVLGTWKPRGVSVVEDFTRLESQARRSADVQAIKAILSASPATTPRKSQASERDEDAVLRRSLAMWQKRTGHSGNITINQESEASSSSAQSLVSSPSSRTIKVEPEPMKLVGHAKIVRRSDSSIKKGHLMLLVDAGESKWERRWFVLRRPHLYIYAHSNELDETGVITLSGVKVECNPDMEALFGRKHTFTLFTASNSHALSAPSTKELQSWLVKLDPAYV
ncbi:kinesin-like protein Klp8 [Tulasnella sp. JGI-2019a]|nr:kinesin-like protein Klp8 [Tulasnella sp. JGI-2019a]